MDDLDVRQFHAFVSDDIGARVPGKLVVMWSFRILLQNLDILN